MASGPVLLYDGTCGFCAESVQFVLKHDHKESLRFAALDSSFGRAVLERHPEIAGVDSLLWVVPARDDTSPEIVHTRSAAALDVASYLGGIWRLAMLARLVPRPLRDAAYRFVATHRHQLTRVGRLCFVPTTSQRARFLP